ncbi:hypothetical protein CY0110_18727 [Crocosphaera chwakensis CCY0110]|uniref:Uncharacterized protein n=1 Tax=Crocosphaera chwakensis CCY0110 TaxID=391612 RepID=A3IJ77_9CHRO|nr:hypothetical protein CY0110_18727 [Crocosphaera chwakensis CCY0110]
MNQHIRLLYFGLYFLVEVEIILAVKLV